MTAQDDSRDDEDFTLAELSDEQLVEQMHDDLYDGLKEEIEEGTTILLERGWSAEAVLNESLVGGMKILRPLLAETGVKPIGKMVIGTVRGDIHDIGKNLVAMMMEGAGFEVFNIGINNSVEDYFAALEEHEPDILGMSALLTTTMPYMKVVVDEMVRQGIRDDYIVLVGGAPLNEEFGLAIGANAYYRDAAQTAENAPLILQAGRDVAPA